VELHFVSNHKLVHTLQCSQVLGTVLAVIQHMLRLSSLFIYPTNAQLDCSKRMLQFTLKILLHVSI